MLADARRFRDRPGAAARDGHRQRHARFVLRRRPPTQTRQAIAHCERLVARGRRHPRHRRRVDPPGRRAGAAATRSWRACCRCCALRSTLGVPVSVDTHKPEVMRAALDLGADIVNDIEALRAPGALDVVAGASALRRLPDAHAAASRRRCSGDRATTTSSPRSRRSCASAVPRLQARGIARRAHRARSRASASARRVDAQLRAAARASASCWRSAIRCWSAGRASRRSARSPAAPVHERVVRERRRRRSLPWRRARRIVRVHDVAATVDALAVWNACRAAGVDNP